MVMSAAEIHKGDVGIRFIVTIYKTDGSLRDVSGFTTKQMIFKKPSGTLITKDTSFYTDGTDGKIYYTTDSASVLDEVGNWQMQVYLTDGATTKRLNINNFIVYINLL
jgi:hypothetical protein